MTAPATTARGLEASALVEMPVPARPRAGVVQRVAAGLTGSRWFWALFMATVFGLPIVRSVRRPLPAAPPVLAAFPTFALSDQTGRAFGPDQVRGQILIAEFVSAASLETGTASPLARLQKRVRNTGNAVHLVSFLESAAPLGAADLARLADDAHAGPSRWTLAADATGDLEARTITALGAPKDFSASLEGRLLLVDGKGRIRRILGTTPDEIDLMMRDIGLLANLEGM